MIPKPEPTPQEIANAIAPEFKDSPYFDQAEKNMSEQWDNLIIPLIGGVIQQADVVLEIACGHGRNSAMILRDFPALKKLILTDVNQECIDFCKKRFHLQPTQRIVDDVRIEFIKNNGTDLHEVESNSVTFVYSFDSMVHFHEKLMEAYMTEIARVLKPGGHGFIHHSNLAGIREAKFENINNVGNPHKRSFMSSVEMVNMSTMSGLIVYAQTLLTWDNIHGLDCLTLFRKPGQKSKIISGSKLTMVH